MSERISAAELERLIEAQGRLASETHTWLTERERRMCWETMAALRQAAQTEREREQREREMSKDWRNHFTAW